MQMYLITPELTAGFSSKALKHEFVLLELKNE